MEVGRQHRMDRQLFEAASMGDVQFFDNLTDPKNTLLKVTIAKNSTVLHVALQFKKFEVVEKIVYFCPSLVYETNSKGNTPLHVAAMVGNSLLVKFLIDHAKKLEVKSGGGQLLSKVNLNGDTALHVAVRYGKSEIVKVLIMEDPELAKCENEARESALFLAVDKQRYDMASYILRAAPNCSCAGRHGMNVLHAVVIHTSTYSNKGNLLLPGDMEKYGQISRSNGFVTTFVLIINMLFLIPLGTLFEKDDERKDPILLRTLGTIPEDFVKEVMEKWPSTIEKGDIDSGWTPLHIATHMGDRKFVKLFLENDNSPAYVGSKEGLSALHIAAKKGNVDIMRELMKACPDMYELLDNDGRNALHVAAESGERTAVQFFLIRPELEGLINEQDKDGNTPMHLAAINGHYGIVYQLARCRGVNSNAANNNGITTMDIVLSGKLDFQLMEALWMEGARPSLLEMLKKAEKEENSKPKSSDAEREAELRDKGMSNSNSDFMKQKSDSTLVVATLIATVTFTAAFTVPGGYESQDCVDEGSAVLSKKTAFQIFLIANSAAFGLSLASVFSHFTASNMILDFIQRKKFVARAPDSTSYSTFAMLLAFILGTYTVVPHNMGITVAVIVCWCFFGSYIISLLHILKSSLSLLVSSSIKKKEEEVRKNYSPNKKQNKEELKKNYSKTPRSDSGMSTLAPTKATP